MSLSAALPRYAHRLLREPRTHQRRRELMEFRVEFESFASTVLEGVRFGSDRSLTESHGLHRAALISRYSSLRPFLLSYMEADHIRCDFTESGYSTDALEALVAAPDLDRLLIEDDQLLISRISRAREALCLYGEHLKWLAARGS